MSQRLNLAVLLSAGSYFAAEHFGVQEAIYITKPLTTILIIAIASSYTSENNRYKKMILAGLTFSLAGDVLLLFPEKLFLQGLVAFLCAHLCYITAFTLGREIFKFSLYSVFILAYAAITVPQLWGFLGKMQIPVAIYMGVILIMLWQAIERWRDLLRASVLMSSSGTIAAIGAIFFITSDTALAFAKFRGAYFGSRILIMATYYIAQWCIARSVHNAPSKIGATVI
jgi:uncharacterized membrane protein YhhN